MTQNAKRKSDENTKLFDDKPRNDSEPASRAESTYAFLDRSSLPEFAKIRHMLERWVARLPRKSRQNAVGSMRKKGPGSKSEEYQFKETFFELFVHEFLLGTGGEVAVDPKINGRTPDFRVVERIANRSQMVYVVEATVIDLERGTNLEEDWNELLIIDWLNEISSPYYYLYIDMKGKLASVPRKRDLKQPFEDLIEKADSENFHLISQEHHFDREDCPKTAFAHGDWTVFGKLVPVSPEYRGRTGPFVANSPIKSDHLNDIDKTKDGLYEKVKRYKYVDNLIIALGCDSWNRRLSEMLFGSRQFNIYIHEDPDDTDSLREPYYTQKLNGFWINCAGPQNSNVIGIVVFDGVHPCSLGGIEATFYSNPYVDLPFPEWTKAITHTEYTDDKLSIVKGVSPATFLRDYEVISNPFG